MQTYIHTCPAHIHTHTHTQTHTHLLGGDDIKDSRQHQVFGRLNQRDGTCRENVLVPLCIYSLIKHYY